MSIETSTDGKETIEYLFDKEKWDVILPELNSLYFDRVDKEFGGDETIIELLKHMSPTSIIFYDPDKDSSDVTLDFGSDKSFWGLTLAFLNNELHSILKNEPFNIPARYADNIYIKGLISFPYLIEGKAWSTHSECWQGTCYCGGGIYTYDWLCN